MLDRKRVTRLVTLVTLVTLQENVICKKRVTRVTRVTRSILSSLHVKSSVVADYRARVTRVTNFLVKLIGY